jgi:hypothetical protein
MPPEQEQKQKNKTEKFNKTNNVGGLIST